MLGVMLLVPVCRVAVALLVAGAEAGSALDVAPPGPGRPVGGMPPVLPSTPAPTLALAPEAAPAASSARACWGSSREAADESLERHRAGIEGASDEAAALAAAREYFECVESRLWAEVDPDEVRRVAREAMALELPPVVAAEPEVAAARQEVARRGAYQLRREARHRALAAHWAGLRRDVGGAIDAEVAAAARYLEAAALVEEFGHAAPLEGEAAACLHRAFILAAEHHALWAVCPAIEAGHVSTPQLDLDRFLCDPPRMSSRERAALRARVDALAGFNERERQAWSRRLRLYDPQDLVGIGAAGLSLAALAGSLTLRSRYHGNCFQIGGPPRCADDPAIPARGAWAGSVVLAVAAGGLAVASVALLAERRLRRRARRCAPGVGGALVCAF